MKVSDLKEYLESFDEDTEVYFSYNYGDHCQTQVAQSVENVYEGAVKHSDYHRMKAIDDDAEETNAIIIS